MAKPKAKAEQLQDKEISTSELAAIVGKSSAWIRQLTRDGVLKQVGRGKYVLSDAIQAYLEHVSGGSAAAEDDRPKLRDEQAELTRIKKEDAMLDLAIKRGELHRAEDVRLVMTDMLLKFRTRVMAMPAVLAPRVAMKSDAGEIRNIIEGEARAVLTTLADYKPEDFKEGAFDERALAEDA